MSEREDFSDDEWHTLRAAVWQAPMGVIEIDPSGTITAGHEVEAVEAVLAAKQFDEGLIGLITRDLLDADAATPEDVPDAGPTNAAAEAATDLESFPDRVIDAMAEVRRVLDTKAPGESEAYRAWLFELATVAAQAGREGFAGLAGPKVSDDEAGYLQQLQDALGV
jgi:hypothetical protein